MNGFKVALLQMDRGSYDLEASQKKGMEYCRTAAMLGADIALFPEMWSVGYTSTLESSPEEMTDLWRSPGLQTGEINTQQLIDVWQGLSISQSHPWFTSFQDLARELNLAIALTYLQQWEKFPRNAVSIIDRRGNVLLTYAKVHTCDWSMDEMALTPGDDFHVCSLETGKDEVKLGAMICYDREHPESARILMLKGAEIILTPNACDMEPNRLTQFKTRSYENMVGVAMTNYAAPRWGHSIAFDPIAFDKEGSRNNLVIEAGESEGVYIASFDMNAIRDFRRRESWGNAFRRPHRYGALTSTGVQEPFTRFNHAGQQYDRTKR